MVQGDGAVVSKDITRYAIAVGSIMQIKKNKFLEEQNPKIKNDK